MRLRRIIRILLIVLIVVLVVPFLIPLPAQGVDPTTLAGEDSQFIDVDGVQAHYIDRGSSDATVVMLIHGFGGSTFSWRSNINALVEAGYRVIAVDLPGFGLSEKRADIDYSHPAQADFLARLMEILGVDQAVMVGHSMGGNVIAHFALRHPEKVEKLVFVDGSVLSGSPPSAAGAITAFPPISRWMQIAFRGLITPERLTGILSSAYADPAVVTPEVAAGYAQVLHTPDWDIALLNITQDSGRNGLSLSELAQIDQPVLVMWGEKDTWIPLEQGQQFSELLPNAAIVTYAESGHLPMEEQPETFNRDLIAFLQDS